MQPFPTRFFYLFCLALGLAWIWMSAVPEGTQMAPLSAPQPGFLAPDFTLKTLDDQSIKLSDLRGKVVLVNIWASWCLPCRAEMPAMENVYQEYKDRDFVVLAVNSTIQDSVTSAETFVEENQLSFPVLLDEDGSTTRAYRVQSLPTSIFIGKDGMIREIIIGGPMAEALLSSRVEKLIEEIP